MNMLRVGGTMIYESDAFLELCDENGILLWQDFMFANMDYPADDDSFAASVERETREQLARLSSHACLTVLCGNSEVAQQAAMWGSPREQWSPPLFHETLATLSSSLCPNVPYWPCSTQGGAFPQQSDKGTSSYYGVGAYLRPLDDARRAAVTFTSECLAFANVPEDKTLAQMPGGLGVRVHQPEWKSRSPRDFGAGWDFDDIRDYYFRELTGCNPLEVRYGDHDRYLALSRVVSGELMARCFAEWRRQESNCRGALIWFLRDFWPGAGWGIIDSAGRPKAPYYFLRRVLQPVALFISDEGGNGLYIDVVNETTHLIDGRLTIDLYRHGELLSGQATHELTLKPRSVSTIPAAELFPGFLDLSYNYRFGPPAHDLVTVTFSDSADSVLSEAFHTPLEIIAGLANDIGLKAQAERTGDDSYIVTVSTRAFAQAVWINSDNCIADDAYFSLAPGKTRKLMLKRDPTAGARKLRARIQAANSRSTTTVEGLQ